MAAGVMPTKDQFDLSGTPCVLCSEPITEGQRYYQRNGWKHLGHMACVMDRPDEWDALPDI